MTTLLISRGYEVLIDEEDHSYLSQWSWTACTPKGRVYARRNDKGRNLFMHRLITNATPEQFVDHINGNTLDNRKSNLRFASNGQNMCNRGKTRANKSGFKGVYFDKEKERWAALIAKDSVKYPLGRLDTAEEAAKAYNAAAAKLHGEFAVLNTFDTK